MSQLDRARRQAAGCAGRLDARPRREQRRRLQPLTGSEAVVVTLLRRVVGARARLLRRATRPARLLWLADRDDRRRRARQPDRPHAHRRRDRLHPAARTGRRSTSPTRSITLGVVALFLILGRGGARCAYRLRPRDERARPLPRAGAAARARRRSGGSSPAPYARRSRGAQERPARAAARGSSSSCPLRRRRTGREPRHVAIAYEDDDLLVVDKPAGLVVHPAAGTHDGTLSQLLAARGAAGGEPWRPGIVHRLDRDTSGLLVVAKSEAAHRR